MTARRIGKDWRDAIEWTQDMLGATRPLAERTLLVLKHRGAAILTEGGVLLSEDDAAVRTVAQQTHLDDEQRRTNGYTRMRRARQRISTPQVRRRTQGTPQAFRKRVPGMFISTQTGQNGVDESDED